MSFKPSHEDWMAYLYNECEDGLKEKIEAYLKNNVEAQQEFAQLKKMRSDCTVHCDCRIIKGIYLACSVLENSCEHSRIVAYRYAMCKVFGVTS
jgi:hypothetical protein